MNREKEKFIAEKLKLIADLTPDYDARKLYIQQIAAAFIADLDGEDAENQVQAPAQEPKKEEPKKEEPKKEEPKKEEPKKEEPKKEEPKKEEPKIAMEDVRAVLANKAVNGFRDEVKALLKEFGAERISDLKPESYEAVIAKAEALV